jgi:NAD(P)-dependent dehydrogenase (short-subunit alcohol dehydrogenase family)
VARKLEGKRVVITGVSRGVGLAITKKFLEEGARVVGVAKDAGRLATIATELGRYEGRFWPICADVTEPCATAKIVEAVRAHLGALDILVNNAAVMLAHDGGFEKEGPDILGKTLAVNVLAPHRLSVALLRLLRAGTEPRIIHLTSGAGVQSAMRDRGLASYRLSKWALNGLAMLQAAELSGQIAVNLLDPGWVKTDMGGPNAPGTTDESADGALTLATLAFTETGKIWCGGQEISF